MRVWFEDERWTVQQVLGSSPEHVYVLLRRKAKVKPGSQPYEEYQLADLRISDVVPDIPAVRSVQRQANEAWCGKEITALRRRGAAADKALQRHAKRFAQELWARKEGGDGSGV